MKAKNTTKLGHQIGPVETGIPIPRRYTACRSQNAVRERVLSLPIGGSFTLAGASPSESVRADVIRLIAWARSRGLALRYRRIDESSARIWRCAPSETVGESAP